MRPGEHSSLANCESVSESPLKLSGQFRLLHVPPRSMSEVSRQSTHREDYEAGIRT